MEETRSDCLVAAPRVVEVGGSTRSVATRGCGGKRGWPICHDVSGYCNAAPHRDIHREASKHRTTGISMNSSICPRTCKFLGSFG